MALRLRLPKIIIFRSAPTSTQYSVITRSYVSKSESVSNLTTKDDTPEDLGAIGKGDKNARPVILAHSAPTDSKDPEVRKHNEEFEKRPDRAANMVDDKKETVKKDFWKGMI